MPLEVLFYSSMSFSNSSLLGRYNKYLLANICLLSLDKVISTMASFLSLQRIMPMVGFRRFLRVNLPFEYSYAPVILFGLRLIIVAFILIIYAHQVNKMRPTQTLRNRWFRILERQVKFSDKFQVPFRISLSELGCKFFGKFGKNKSAIQRSGPLLRKQ